MEDATRPPRAPSPAPRCRRGDGGVRNRSGQDPPRRPSDSPKDESGRQDGRRPGRENSAVVAHLLCRRDAPQPRRHTHLLERDERPRRAEPARCHTDERRADHGLLDGSCARGVGDSGDSLLRARRSLPWPRRSGRRSCESESPVRHGTRPRTARERREESSPPVARARRRPPGTPCVVASRTSSVSSGVGSPAMMRTRTSARATRPSSPTTTAPAADPAPSSFASWSARTPLTTIGPTRAGEISSRRVRPRLFISPTKAATSAPFMPCLVQAHRERECSAGRRSARGSQPSTSRPRSRMGAECPSPAQRPSSYRR